MILICKLKYGVILDKSLNTLIANTRLGEGRFRNKTFYRPAIQQQKISLLSSNYFLVLVGSELILCNDMVPQPPSLGPLK